MGYKHDYDTILTRLVKILSYLNEGRELTSKELAKEFGVCEKTIKRDFDRLTSFPIYKDGRVWKMQEGYRIEKSTSIEEKITLDILESMAKGAGRKFFTNASKLLDKLKNETQNPIYAKLDMEDISSHLKEIALLKEAIKSKRYITCRYQKPITLELKPLKITTFEGFWYLVAIDSKDEKLKKYYLKNLNSIKLTDKNFTPISKLKMLLDSSLSIWFDDGVDPFEVRLFIEKDIAKYFERKPLPTQSIIGKDRDGSLEISLYITNFMEIIPIIKYWMPHIRVLSPQSLKEEIKDDIDRYLSESINSNN